MVKEELPNFKLGISPMDGEIYLYRHGKRDPRVALERKKFTGEVMAIVTEHILKDMPDGATLNYNLGDQAYEMTVKPVEEKVT